MDGQHVQMGKQDRKMAAELRLCEQQGPSPAEAPVTAEGSLCGSLMHILCDGQMTR